MISSKKHPNSRIVKLYRKPSFIGNAQHGAPEFMAMSKRSIGSFWENSYSTTIGSGLNFSEQKLLLPTIVDCEPEDRAFRAKVSEYYSAIKTAVPFDKGRELEIGLETDNNEPLSSINLPLNLSDYVTYRHAKAHPEVAGSKQDGENSMLKFYYIFDAQEQEDFEVLGNKDKDEALVLYLRIKKTPEKADMLLTLMGIDPRTFKGKNAQALKLDKVKVLAETKPSDVVKIFNDKSFDEMYTIQTMLNTSVLQKIGERIINPETGTVLGNDMQEAVYWIKDKLNSESLVMLKARMQEGLQQTPATSKA
jgi:hypothetical protein